MQSHSIPVDESIALFVKDILVFEETDITPVTSLPFYADGYPGLLFHQTKNGLVVNPHDKDMPLLFLYGQTIKPIELVMEGPYRLIIFQLYPFVLRSFFNINPIEINDNCHDLTDIGKELLQKLEEGNKLSSQTDTITSFLFNLFITKKETLDSQIKQAIEAIVNSKGQIVINTLYEKLGITERTFERRFLKEVGLLPKQFSKIIQFQSSFEQLTLKDYCNLSDIVYNNGFADQSHFIRVFKAYTGKTPKHFNSKSN